MSSFVDNDTFSGGLQQDNGLFTSLCFVDSDGLISVAVERCPLCGGTRKPFFCKACIQSGIFSHSSSNGKERCTDRYADKKQRLKQLQADRLQQLKACEEKIAAKLAVDVKKSQIEQLKKKIGLYNQAMQVTREELTKERNTLATLRSLCEERSKKAAKHQEKTAYIIRYMDKLQQNTGKLVQELSQYQVHMQQLRRSQISDLVAFVFPVTEEKWESDDMDPGGDARDKHIGSSYRVVASILPPCDDSADYAVWLMQSPHHSLVTSPRGRRNTSHDVSAALAYCAQLLVVMSVILDCHMPYKLSYSDFCNASFTREQHGRLLSKMNGNILQLCFSQNVKVELLSTLDMLHNLLELIYAADLGRVGPYEVSSMGADDIDDYDVPSLEQSLYDVEDVVDGAEQDWEHVPTSLPEVDTRGSASSSLSPGGADTAAGGFMSSMTSLWRGSFWRKTGSPES